MKLIIKQYLASLKESKELDAILPDLLSQVGLHVITTPTVGARQYGVDIAAVGSLSGKPESVYLFSIKKGDLGRRDWNDGSPQALQPSLDEILSVYIPTHIPTEHAGKPIVICLCVGGDIKQEIRLNVTQYETQKKTSVVRFEEWGGDVLAAMIEENFLREELLPEDIRPSLRKALALLDEPEASFRHFSALIRSLSTNAEQDGAKRLRTVRQINICLWILFAWARDARNLESAYLSAEIALLHAWELSKKHNGDGKFDQAIQAAFASIFHVYDSICAAYVGEKIVPHVDKLHALSMATQSSSRLDVNLKLFDVLGRLATAGIWTNWQLLRLGDADEQLKIPLENRRIVLSESIKKLIVNNPTLFMPFKDDHVIDISLALLCLSAGEQDSENMKSWLTKMMDRAIFSYECHEPYPCLLRSYSELADHPKPKDEEYRKEVTSGSILYPTLALWAALLDDQELYRDVQEAKIKHLEHCNFQFWYPDETTETHFYVHSAAHGSTLSDVPVDLVATDFLEKVWGECKHGDHFKNLSAVKHGIWPLVIVACRHHRMPIPLDFTLGHRKIAQPEAKEEIASATDGDLERRNEAQ